MNNKSIPQDQVYWYHQSLPVAQSIGDKAVEVAVIGGGMAGLSAAHAFAQRGKKVMILEQFYCGSGASGKSSGFITPNAELSLTDYQRHYNLEAAKKIWDFIGKGCEDIRSIIKKHNLSCDYRPQDTLVVANTKSALKELKQEHENLIKYGYQSVYYDAQELPNHINSKSYFGGVGYQNTFGINPFLYCQEMKRILQQQGVLIQEETPVIAIDDHRITTVHGTITADSIVVCVDRFLPNLELLKKKVYHAQTFLMISQKLNPEQISSLFPRDTLMVWDTDLIYTYFRLTGDNRLLLGGGTLLSTYATHEYHDYARMTHKLKRYIATKFPSLQINFVQQWPGLIGISKDMAPIAGRDKDKKHIYYIAAATGLPIAWGLGHYAAQHMIDGDNSLDEYFSPYRSFAIGDGIQTVLGAPLSFALSNGITKYF